MFSIKNFRNGNSVTKNSKITKNPTTKKGKIIIRKKITHKPCNTHPKAKPIDN